MLTKKNLKTRIQNLHYFDTFLEPITDRVESIDSKDERKIKEFENELKIVLKLKNIYIYKMLPETYDILENQKQQMTKNEFKMITTGKDTITEYGIIPKTGSYHVEKKEWDLFEEVYNELITK